MRRGQAAGLLLLATAAGVGLLVDARPQEGLRRVTTVTRGPFRSTVTLSGRVTATRLESYRAPVVPNWRATIKWLVTEGATVRPGEPIVRFDTGTLQTDYETTQIDLDDKLSEGALRAAEAAALLLDKQLVLERARIELDKARVEAAVPQDVRALREHEEKQLALEKAKNAAEAAQVALDSTEEKNRTESAQRDIDVQNAREKLARVKKQLEAMTLSAHQTGVVVLEMNWRTGKKMKSGDQAWSTAPIAYLPDVAATMVQAFAGEAELGRLVPGQPVTLSLDAYPDRRFRGKVTSIARAGEPNDMWGKSPFYSVDIAIEQPDLELMKQGMSVRAEVLVADESDALIVPLAALEFSAGKLTVRTAEGAVPVEVRAVNAFGAAIEPSAALADGTPLGDGLFQFPVEDPAADPVATGAGLRVGKVVAQGTLTSRLKDTLSPSVPGMWRFSITQLAPEGENVTAGTVVVAFDPKELTDRLRLRQSELDSARKELEKTVLDGQQSLEGMQLQSAETKMKLDKAQRKLEVPSELVGSLQQSIEQYDAELAKIEFGLNQHRVETARANLEAKRANQQSKIARLNTQVQQITQSIEAMKLKAPRAGCVVYVIEDEEDGKPRVGGEVWQGRDVVEIADLSQMQVDASVPEPDAGRVRLGQRAEIRLDANPDKLFTGRVTDLGRVFHPKSNETPSIVFDATVSIENPDPQLMRPGMAAEVTILPDEPRKDT